MKFRKRPVVIDAILYTGNNPEEVCEWVGGFGPPDCTLSTNGGVLAIDTLEGTMTASPGDWIIRGVKGELYPCKPDIFAATYEWAEEPARA